MSDHSAEPPRPEVQVVQVDVLGAGLLAVVVRCLATTKVGSRFRCVGRSGGPVVLTVTEIRRYPRVPVTEVDPPHAALLVLEGAGAGEPPVRARDVLRGVDPVA
ncbi:hypothetical protein ACIBL6_00145 [Streptomyces sp. NPDC050400]|uniref:hypothetical protein n=1 Tax=Streptomyces sp. NPDC050400 TaxID=3365610 RepID=UPI00379547BC